MRYLKSISVASELMSRFVVRRCVAFFQSALDIGFNLFKNGHIRRCSLNISNKATFVALDPAK